MATKLVNGVPVEMSPAEEAAFEAGRTPNLAQARRLMRDRIADRRSQAESGGFAHLTKRYDSRGADLARLSILAERARTAKAAAQPFTVRVVASDDSESAFNADETDRARSLGRGSLPGLQRKRAHAAPGRHSRR